MKALVSVISPVYNDETYIATCVESLFKQSYENIQIILVNDGSTDASLDVCRSLADKDKRIALINQENRGVSAARNVGIDSAVGEYICFVDADDFVSPEYISTLLQTVNKTSVNAVFTSSTNVYGDILLPRKSRMKPGKYSFREVEDKYVDDGTLTGMLLGSACVAIFRACIIHDNGIRFREDIKVNEDGIFNLEYLSIADTFFIIDEKSLYFYRQRMDKEPFSMDKLYERDRRFAEADRCLRQLNSIKPITDFEVQMERRKASEMLWAIVGMQSMDIDFRTFYRLCKNRFITFHIPDPSVFPYKSMSIYKAVVAHAVINKSSLWLSFLLFFVFPVLKKYIVR